MRPFLVGFWLLFSTLRLYLIGVGFTRASLSAGVRAAPCAPGSRAAIVGGDLPRDPRELRAELLPSLWSVSPGQAISPR